MLVVRRPRRRQRGRCRWRSGHQDEDRASPVGPRDSIAMRRAVHRGRDMLQPSIFTPAATGGQARAPRENPWRRCGPNCRRAGPTARIGRPGRTADRGGAAFRLEQREELALTQPNLDDRAAANAPRPRDLDGQLAMKGVERPGGKGLRRLVVAAVVHHTPAPGSTPVLVDERGTPAQAASGSVR